MEECMEQVLHRYRSDEESHFPELFQFQLNFLRGKALNIN